MVRRAVSCLAQIHMEQEAESETQFYNSDFMGEMVQE